MFRTILEKSINYDYDAVCKLWIGPKLIVFLFNPDDVELILSSHVYIDKSAEYSFFKPWLGDGLLISTGKLTLELRVYNVPPFFYVFNLLEDIAYILYIKWPIKEIFFFFFN